MPLIFVFIVIIIIANIIYVKSYKSIRNFIFKKEIKKEIGQLHREINVNYSPSVVSYLYNQKIEPEKDLVADILNLYARKIINIRETGADDYILELNREIFDKKLDKNEIFENDIYLINSMVLKVCEFDYEDYLNRIIKVYRQKINKKIEDNAKKINCFKSSNKKTKRMSDELKVILLIVILPFAYAILGGVLSSKIDSNTMILIASIISVLIVISIFAILVGISIKNVKNKNENIDMHLTKEAKEELRKWMKFENFINEGTLLKERNFEEIILFEQYIPFAMVLNINKKYKEDLVKILHKNEINLVFNSVKKYNKINNVFVQYM